MLVNLGGTNYRIKKTEQYVNNVHIVSWYNHVCGVCEAKHRRELQLIPNAKMLTVWDNIASTIIQVEYSL